MRPVQQSGSKKGMKCEGNIVKKKLLLISLICCLCLGSFSACGLSAGEGAQAGTGETSETTIISREVREQGMQGNPAEDMGSEGRISGGNTAGEELPGEETEKGYPEYFEEQAGRYAFETLSEPEKYWYVDIYRTLEAMETEAELNEIGNSAVGVNGIDKVFQCVLNDHPEIFYVTGYTYTQYTHGEETVRMVFSGTYTMDPEEVQIRKEQIALYVEECLAGISPDSTEYELVKYVYEYLITHTQYNLQAAENQNICSVFIGRESVCQGYAKAAQYLLELLGVESTLVIGRVNNEGHAWNLVRIDGEYYYVDTTWGDASYQITEEGAEAGAGNLPSINYDYLCVTTKLLSQTHIIDNVVPMPECTSMAANYYVCEGAYFTEYSEPQLEALFQKGYAQGKKDVTLKCADENTYRTIFEELVTNLQIFRYLDMTDGTVAYVDNITQLSMTFWLAGEEAANSGGN